MADRLESVKNASSRSRGAFIILTTASIAVLVTTYNSYLSWSDFMTFQSRWPRSLASGVSRSHAGPTVKREVSIGPTQAATVHSTSSEPAEVLKDTQAQYIGEWVKSRWLSVGPLGIQVSCDDLAIWAPIGLAFMTIWFFASVRRENHVIGDLLVETRGDPVPVKLYVFHGVVNRLLFISVSMRTSPVSSLEAVLSVPREKGASLPPGTSLRYRLVSRVFDVFLYLPVLAMFLVVVLDVSSWFLLDSPFNVAHLPIWFGAEHTPRFYARLARAGLMDSFALASVFFLASLLKEVHRHEQATTSLLQEYWWGMQPGGTEGVGREARGREER